MQFVITTHDDCTLTDASNIRTMLATYEPLTPMIVIGPLPNRIAKAVYESVWGYRNTWWAVGSVCIDIGLLDRSNPDPKLWTAKAEYDAGFIRHYIESRRPKTWKSDWTLSHGLASVLEYQFQLKDWN